MSSVFISYAHADSEIAIKLQNEFAAAGLTCWRDERCIRTGDDFAVEITRAIRDCKLFVLLLSPASNSSDYVHKEVAIAYHFGRQIIPVLIDETDLSDEILPYVVRSHRCDLRRQSSRDLALDIKTRIEASGERTATMPLPDHSELSGADNGRAQKIDSRKFVSKNEYRLFLASARQKTLDRNNLLNSFSDDQGEDPVVGVSWTNAMEYCDWRGGCLPASSGAQLAKTKSVSKSYHIAEWRDGGSERFKHICDPYTSKVVAVMDRETCPADVGFRCISVSEPIPTEWIHINGGHCWAGTDIETLSRLNKEYHLPLGVTRPVFNRRSLRCSNSEYTISATCVTNQEYFLFTRATGKPWPSYWSANWLGLFEYPFPLRLASMPVVSVTAEQAQAYCIWSRTRLPTWMEWQRAASGQKGCPYPWGAVFDAIRCNSKESERGSLTRVDEYRNGNSPEGVRQLSGNVAEFAIGPQNAFEIRGGSYRVPCEIWGLSYMFRQVESTFHAKDVGFRVILD